MDAALCPDTAEVQLEKSTDKVSKVIVQVEISSTENAALTNIENGGNIHCERDDSSSTSHTLHCVF
jgi:hypothetical protein